jgi:hypothetical protein
LDDPDQDLPLYVAGDPEPEPHDRSHSLAHALEVIAETFHRGDGERSDVVGGTEPPPLPRADRSSLILRRFLLVTPAGAMPRFDDWFATSPTFVRTGKGCWRLTSGPAAAVEDPEDDPRRASTRLRKVEGRLRLRFSPIAVPVVLELLPWYSSRVVIDMRPADRKKKLTWLRRETYFLTAHSLLDKLRTHLELVPSD